MYAYVTVTPIGVQPSANGRTVRFRACRPRLICRPYPYSTWYSYSLVNVTLNMRYKNDKKCQICHHIFVFFQAQNCIKIRFWLGLRPLVGCEGGGGVPFPDSPPLDDFGVSSRLVSVLRLP